MKKELFALGGMLFLLTMTACNTGGSTTSTDSTSVTTGSTQSETGTMGSSQTSIVHLDPSVSYVNLKTGKQVKLRVDTVTKYVVEETTNQPVMYYINPSTNDTFDRTGRVVNHALIKNSNGDYSVDETRITVSTDNSSNMTTSDSGTSHAATDNGSASSGNSKTKIKDDKLKQKTDTSTFKVKEDKIKIKTKSND